MVEGKCTETWNHTATLWAVIVNMHRDPKKPAVKPEKIHPYIQRDDSVIRITKDNVSLLRKEFTGS